MKKLVRVSLFVLMALALSLAIGCKHDSDPEQKPASSNFVGRWKSTDGSTTVTVTSDTFTTKMPGMPDPISGTYTVSPDGKTLTTSKISFPEDMGGPKAVSMKLKDSETDVMDLPLSKISEKLGKDLVLVKESSTKFNLNGTWTGNVVIDGEEILRDATIVFIDNNATLKLPENQDVTATVTQNGNFFTIRRGGDDQELVESTGLISVSGKAWLDDGFVFTKE